MATSTKKGRKVQCLVKTDERICSEAFASEEEAELHRREVHGLDATAERTTHWSRTKKPSGAVVSSTVNSKGAMLERLIDPTIGLAWTALISFFGGDTAAPAFMPAGKAWRGTRLHGSLGLVPAVANGSLSS